MPDDEFCHRVVATAAHVGTFIGRGQVHRHDPGQRDDQKHYRRQGQVKWAFPPTHGSRDCIEEIEGRQYQESLQHLNVEPQTHQHGAEQQPAQLARLSGADDRPGRQQENQDQQTVHRVVAVGGHTDGSDRQHQRRQQPGRRAKGPPHEVIEQEHGKDASQCLGEKQADAVETEKRGAGRLRPQAQRRLIHRHEPAGVEGDEEKVVPTGEHALHGSSVVQVGVSLLFQPEEVQEHGQQQDPRQCDAVPGSGGPFGRRHGSRMVGSFIHRSFPQLFTSFPGDRRVSRV